MIFIHVTNIASSFHTYHIKNYSHCSQSRKQEFLKHSELLLNLKSGAKR